MPMSVEAMKDPRGRSIYDDVPINYGESEFREFDDDSDLCTTEQCRDGNHEECPDMDANCCECGCHLRP